MDSFFEFIFENDTINTYISKPLGGSNYSTYISFVIGLVLLGVITYACYYILILIKKLFTNTKTYLAHDGTYYAKHYNVFANNDLTKSVFSSPINKLYTKIIFTVNNTKSQLDLLKMNNNELIFVNKNKLIIKLGEAIVFNNYIELEEERKYTLEVKTSNNVIGIHLKSTNDNDEEENTLVLTSVNPRIDLSKIKMNSYIIPYSNNSIAIDEVVIDVNKYNTADL